MFQGTSPGTTTGGMGGMMGQTGTTQTSANSLLPYFGVFFAIAIAITVIGIVGLAYYLVYPQIRMGSAPIQPIVQNASQQVSAPIITGSASPYESVSKTLTDEERKIITVLNAHNGKYLQKYIKSETGLAAFKPTESSPAWQTEASFRWKKQATPTKSTWQVGCKKQINHKLKILFYFAIKESCSNERFCGCIITTANAFSVKIIFFFSSCLAPTM